MQNLVVHGPKSFTDRFWPCTHLPYVPAYSLIPTWRKKSANQNPLLRNDDAFPPQSEVCAASSFLCVISGCNQSMLTTAPSIVTLHDYNLRLRTQTVSSGEHWFRLAKLQPKPVLANNVGKSSTPQYLVVSIAACWVPLYKMTIDLK